MRIPPEEYAELVLTCVEEVPPGRVTSYGAIAEAIGPAAGGGGPRLVGSVLARDGAGVAWWRVVRADGTLPPSHQGEALAAYRAEGTPVRSTAAGSVRVDLDACRWTPARRESPGA